MNDHFHYEELAALSAGGLLSETEKKELREHTIVCAECLRTEEEFHELVRSGLPLTAGPLHRFLQGLRTKSDGALRSRFLECARSEGVVFSPDVEKPPGGR